MILILDPGHGGNDPGAVGPSGTKEKVIALAIALQTAAILRQIVEVKLTRETDTDPALVDRAIMADTAELFVSIHCNSVADRTANGTEVLIYPGSVGGRRLAEILLPRLVKTLGTVNRGIKERPDLAVLRLTNYPAVLVELAFLSHPGEEAMLNDPESHAAIAMAVAEGVAEYLGLKLPPTEDPRAVQETIVPDWAKNSIMWAVANGLITNQAGSEDFYRLITVLHRYDMRKVDADAMP